jgi:hypothetical protein
MTGEEHYQRAETLLTLLAEMDEMSADDRADLIGQGQIHSTLALTAATYGTWTVELGS